MAPHSTTVVSAQDLTKRFGDLVAVDGISFAIQEGECFGFLGPNGAGKTTVMRMITCLSPVTSGDLSVLGMSVARDQRRIKSRLGVVSQADSLDPGLNVLQNLVAYARFFDLPREVAGDRIREALDLFHLGPRADSPIDALSGGMRRRLLIARALLHRPTVLVLDEPTTGLDPQSRHLVWEKLNLLKSEGITVLLTTHYMEEAAYLCDRIVVVEQGRILAEGAPAELIGHHAGDWIVEIRGDSHQKERLLDLLRDRGLEFDDAGEHVIVYARDGTLPAADALLDGYRVLRGPSNLEDVFLRLTGRGLREE